LQWYDVAQEAIQTYLRAYYRRQLHDFLPRQEFANLNNVARSIDQIRQVL
jgi:hypothetical protein